MAQAFVTTYKNDFRWNPQPRVQPINPDTSASFELSDDIWILGTEFGDEDDENFSQAKDAIHKMMVKRMKSTYQVSYCKEHRDEIARTIDEENMVTPYRRSRGPSLATELVLNQAKIIYEDEPQKLLPPLESARHVFGYIRPDNLRVPLTVYQNGYGRVAFNILKKDNKDIIIC